MEGLVKAEDILKVLENSNESLWCLDLDENLYLSNCCFYNQFDLGSKKPTLSTWLNLIHKDEAFDFNKKLMTLKESYVGDSLITRYRVRNSSGQYLWIESNILKVHNSGITCILSRNKDISEQVFFHESLKNLFYFESDLGLLDKSILSNDLVNFDRSSWAFVCTLTKLRQDLRTIGSGVIDEVTERLVRSITLSFDCSYNIYRISSDVFVFIIDKPYSIKDVENYIFNLEKAFNNYFSDGNDYSSNSLVIAASKLDYFYDDEPIDNIFKLSQFSCLDKKSYILNSEIKLLIQRYFYINETLDKAISSNEIGIVLQPIVDFRSGEYLSFESLARWNDKEIGVVPPSEFIPIAEKNGKIYELGMNVLKKSCEFLKTFQVKKKIKTLVNVNVSAYQIFNSSFVDDCLNIVSMENLKPSSVVLEITESYLIDNNLIILEKLNELNKLGFKISIDDFGSGLSSIASLYNLPLYQIKLDSNLINDVVNYERCLSLVKIICDYGEKFDINVVAEGVEDNDVLLIIKELNIRFAQGYSFSKPCPPEYWLSNEIS